MTLVFLRRSLALLLALALFAPGSAFGRVLYACSMSGKVSATRCCCHRHVAATKGAPQRAQPPKAQAPGCCEKQDHRRATVPASTNPTELPVLATPPGELLPAVPPLLEAGNALHPQPHLARGPPHAQAVYTVNCSLLI